MSVKKYKDHPTIWSFLCKRDFKEWIPQNDDEWSFHFLNLKPGNYFGLYCYFDGILNHRYYSIDCDKKSALMISIPLYFALKKYNRVKDDMMVSIPKSTRGIAIIERMIKKEKDSYTLEEILDWNSLAITPSNNGILFSHALCIDCDFKKLEKKSQSFCLALRFPGLMHFRNEDTCLCYEMASHKRLYVIHFSNVKNGEFLTCGRSFEEEFYKNSSDAFKINKINFIA